MLNFEDVKKENIKEHNTYWPQILDHPYKILIFGGSGSGKTNALLNLINHKPYCDKCISMLKIHLKQNTNFRLIKAKL